MLCDAWPRAVCSTDYICEFLSSLPSVCEHQLPNNMRYFDPLMQRSSQILDGRSESDHLPLLRILSCFVNFWTHSKHQGCQINFFKFNFRLTSCRNLLIRFNFVLIYKTTSSVTKRIWPSGDWRNFKGNVHQDGRNTKLASGHCIQSV